MDESGGEPAARQAQRTARIGMTLAAAGIAAALAVAWHLRPTPEAPETATPSPIPITPPPAREVAAQPAPLSEGAKIDVVRVETDGSALVAGSAPPGATVVILLDGVETAPARADSAGKFVTFLVLGAGREPRLLSARVEMPDGRRIDGTETVVIAPAALAAAAPDSAGEAALAPVEPETTPPTGETTTPADRAAPAEAAPAVLAAGPEGLRVLDAVDGVAIDTMAYDPGGLRFGGRGAPRAQLRLYVDNRPVGEVEIGEDGAWQLVLPDIAQGSHALRADLLDEGGAVTARYELPFMAEDAPRLPAAPAGGPAISVVTVQPGQSLWRIAQDRYGDGAAYVRLFEANKSRIRDPDLIYPGQTFDIPD